MKYAVIKSGGKQYKVSEGEEILLDKLLLQKGDNYIFPEVVLIRDGEKITIGNPYVAEGKVSGKVLDQIKGDKVTIAKFKAKVHFRRKLGFRPLYTKIMIEKISVGTDSASRSKAAAPKNKEKRELREKYFWHICKSQCCPPACQSKIIGGLTSVKISAMLCRQLLSN